MRKTHGLSQHPLYHVWTSMMGRCRNKNHPNYHHYGGRGITVCDEWLNTKTFIDWLEVNGYSDSLEVDRMDNDKGYSPENCHVVTRRVNCRNTRSNVRYTVHGEELFLWEIEEKYGVRGRTFRYRVETQSRTPEQALHSTKKPYVYAWDIDGQMMSRADIEREFGVSKGTFSGRLQAGWSGYRAAKTPVRRLAKSRS